LGCVEHPNGTLKFCLTC